MKDKNQITSRKPNGEPKTKTLTVTDIPLDDIRWLEEQAKLQCGIPLTALIRQLIRQAREQNEKENVC